MNIYFIYYIKTTQIENRERDHKQLQLLINVYMFILSSFFSITLYCYLYILLRPQKKKYIYIYKTTDPVVCRLLGITIKAPHAECLTLVFYINIYEYKQHCHKLEYIMFMKKY